MMIMLDSSLTKYVVPAVLLLVFVLVQRVQRSKRTFVDVPAVGPSGYYGGLKYFTNAQNVLQEGYEKYKNKAFKVAHISRWLVIVSGAELVDDIRKAPEDDISASVSANDLSQVEFTLGQDILSNPYHITLLHSHLTRNLGLLFDTIRDEVVCALDDTLQLQDDSDGWKKVTGNDLMMRLVSRVTNRVFVGLPICRDPGYIDLTVGFAIAVFTGAAKAKLFPRFLRPFVVRYFTQVKQSMKRCERLIAPIVTERQKLMDEYGTDWPDKPLDMLTWLMEHPTKSGHKTVKELTTRIMTLNFAGVHATSIGATHMLFNLAANPEYATPLRDEIEAAVKEEGWSKAALDKMHKVDSFIKETLRYPGMGCTAITRAVMKPRTLSDGTFLPAGTFVSVLSGSMHTDDALYEDARTFKPFRFADMREKDGEELKHQLVSTSLDFLTFGHGAHACPGRFFVAIELKSLLAHIVVNYDVKFEGDRPENQWFSSYCLPDSKAKVMFRRRLQQ